MGDVVNLRAARKAKARAMAGDTAAANRAKFGRTKGEKRRDAAEIGRLDAAVAGAKLDGQPHPVPRHPREGGDP